MVETEKQGNLTLQRYLAALEQMVQMLSPLEDKRIRLRTILADDEQIEKVNREYLAIKIVEEVRKSKDPEEFMRKLSEKMGEIEKYDTDLGMRMVNVLIEHSQKDPLIKQICSILGRYPYDRSYVHFMKYRERYANALARSKDISSKKVEELLTTFLSRYGALTRRLQELERYRKVKDVFNGGNLNFAIQQTNSALTAIERIGRMKKEDAVKKHPATDIRPLIHMLSLPTELSYLSEISDKIKRGEQEGSWEEFEEVLRGSRNRIPEILENKYGDSESARKFREWRKFHEDPQAWLRAVEQLRSELFEKQLQIMQKAKESFDRLLSKYASIISEEYSPEYEKNKEDAQAILKEETEEPRKARRKIMKLKNKRKRAIKRLVAIKRKKYKKLEDKEYPNILKFLDSIDKFRRRSGVDRLKHRAEEVKNDFLRHSVHARELSSRFGRYGNKYDIALLAPLMGSIAAIRTAEDRFIEGGVVISRAIADLWEELVENRASALQSADNIVDMLDQIFRGGENG